MELEDVVCKLAFPGPSPLGGTGLKAIEQIPTDTKILTVKTPLIKALDVPRLEDTCYECLEKTQRRGLKTLEKTIEDPVVLKRCTGCQTVRYCSRECQANSWRTVHKHECKLFAQLHPRILPSNVRGIVTLLVMQKKGLVQKEVWESFMTLESHEDDFQRAGGEVWENLVLMAKAAHHYSKTTLLEGQVLGIMTRVMVNCFTLTTETFDPLGLVMHPLPSRMNHSCDFNAYVQRGGGGLLSVVAAKPIKQGEEVMISYIDSTYPTRIRKKQLKERYFFDCQCTKCQNPWDCDFDLNILTETKKLQVLETEARVTELLKSAHGDDDPSSQLKSLENAMQLLHDHKDWPLHQQPFPEVRHAYIVTLLAAGQYHAAFAQATIQKLLVDPNLYSPKHPLAVVHDLVIVDLISFMTESTDLPPQSLDISLYQIDLLTLRAWILVDLERRLSANTENALFHMLKANLHDVERDLARKQSAVHDCLASLRRLVDDTLKREKEMV